MNNITAHKPVPSSAVGAISAALTTAIGYLAGLGFDLSQVDWSVAWNWLTGLMALGAGAGYVTSDRTKDKPKADSGFKFSARSIQNLSGVHPDMIQIATRALQLSRYDFAITSGVRTVDEQKALVESGHSSIMNSRHLHGLAVDIAVWTEHDVTWDMNYYRSVSNAFKRAALELGIQIVWGGNWDQEDGPHFELSKAQYPDNVLALA